MANKRNAGKKAAGSKKLRQAKKMKEVKPLISLSYQKIEY